MAKKVEVQSLNPGDEFELLEEVMGLEPDRYTYEGNPEKAKWELPNSVYIESRHGDKFVIPKDTKVVKL